MPKRKKVDNLIKIKKKVLFQTYHLEQVRRHFGKQRVIANCIFAKVRFFKRGWQKKKHFSLFYPLLFVILQNHSSISSDT